METILALLKKLVQSSLSLFFRVQPISAKESKCHSCFVNSLFSSFPGCSFLFKYFRHALWKKKSWIGKFSVSIVEFCFTEKYSSMRVCDTEPEIVEDPLHDKMYSAIIVKLKDQSISPSFTIYKCNTFHINLKTFSTFEIFLRMYKVGLENKKAQHFVLETKSDWKHQFSTSCISSWSRRLHKLDLRRLIYFHSEHKKTSTSKVLTFFNSKFLCLDQKVCQLYQKTAMETLVLFFWGISHVTWSTTRC